MEVAKLPSFVTVDIDPMGAPRMTRSDKWKKRPVVMRYFAFRDALRLRVKEIPARLYLHFEIAMPTSWPESRKKAMFGRPHQARPDLDNMIKAVQDSLCSEDAFVWALSASKTWAYTGRITFGALQ